MVERINFQKLRLKNNLTVRQVSTKTGIGMIQLKRIENGEEIPSPGDYEILIEYYFVWLPKHINELKSQIKKGA